MKTSLCLIVIICIVSAASNQGLICDGADTRIQATRTNNICQQGYYWNTQACMPCQYVSYGYYTCSSYLGTGTLTCDSNCSLINGSCITNPTGCTGIQLNSNKNGFDCTACSTGYTMIQGVCLANNQCSAWDQNAVCTSCVDGFYLNWDLQFQMTSTSYGSSVWLGYPYLSGQSFCNSCQQTMPNCKTCNSAYTCTTCQDGYYWQQSVSATKLTSQNSQNAGACVSCLNGCLTCTSAGSCTACLSNYYPTKDSNSVITQCTMCPQGCSTCSSSTTCTACYSSYYMFTDNKCYSMLYCQAVNVSATTNGPTPACSSCVTNYALNNSNVCIKCPQGCQSCTVSTTAQNTTTCTTCQDTYYGVKDANGIVTCTSCSTITGYLRCSGPVENSSYATQVPTQCIDGYYLYTIPAQGSTNAQTTCIKSVQSQQCTLIQATISTQYTCTSCTTPITTLYANGQCLACDSLSTTSLPAGCSQCTGSPSSTISCTACLPQYYFSSSNGVATCTLCNDQCTQCGSGPTCTQCKKGYYVSAGLCTKCGVNNCDVCPAATPTTCTTCSDGYFLLSSTSNGVTTSYCLSCPSECATCAPNGQTCLTCSYGYVFQNGGCVYLGDANCSQEYSTFALTTYNQNGCAICQYGFYNFQNRCLQIIQPYAAAVQKQSSPISIGTQPSTVYETILSISLLILIAY